MGAAQSFRNVAITGASAGVGRATALAFARHGWNVALMARGTDGLDAARRDVEHAGGQALALVVDVADPEQVFAAADQVARAWGGIDVWVNNAMATIFAPLHDITPEEFRRVTEVTYLGQVHGTMAALKHMRPRNAGTIVQVGSALSYCAIPLQSAYCGAKFAVRGFTDALRSELLHEGSHVRLTMVQLPAVNTPQFNWARNRLPRRPQPVPPIYEPEAIAEAILRAAHHAPRELWLGKSALQAILAAMLAPGWVDRLLASKGYEGQLSRQKASRERDGNLFTPLDTEQDQGAHGRFGDRAREHLVTFDPATLRVGLALCVLGLATSLLPRRHPVKGGSARARPRRHARAEEARAIRSR